MKLNFIEQTLDTLRLFQRVQILALDILDECHRGGSLIGHVAHQDRHFFEAARRAARKRRSPAMISNFSETAAPESAASDPERECWPPVPLQGTLVHARARLILARLHFVERQRVRCAVDLHRFRDIRASAEQCLQPLPNPSSVLLRSSWFLDPLWMIDAAS